MGLGGNRAGDAGAAALAAAVEPRMNPDGAWVTPRLHALDASENGIGKEGLWAFARAVDPKCARCLRGYGWSRRNSVADFEKPRGGGGQVRSRVRSGEPGNAGRRPGMLARRRRERRPQRRVEPDDFAAIAFVPTVAVYLAVYLAV